MIHSMRLWLLCAVLPLSGPVSAQFVLGAPSAPGSPTPASIVQRVPAAGPLSLTQQNPLSWTAPATASNGTPLPSHFAVCIYPAAAPVGCNWTNKTWSAAASGGNGLTRTSIYGPAPVFGPPSAPLLTGYRYSFNPQSPVAQTLLNRPLKWSVGACATRTLNGVSSMVCNFAAPRDLHLTSINIQASNADITSHPFGVFQVEIRARNPDPTDSATGIFSVRVTIEEPLYEVRAGFVSCRTDANAPDLAQDPGRYFVVYGNQRPRLLRDVLAETPVIDTSNVVAIFELVGQAFERSGNSILSLPSGLSTSTNVYELALSAEGRRAIVAIAELDYDNRIVEHNETDNIQARCRGYNPA